MTTSQYYQSNTGTTVSICPHFPVSIEADAIPLVNPKANAGFQVYEMCNESAVTT